MSEKELQEQKKRDGQKFIKVYMLTLLSVVITLLLISYFAQNKLTTEIETLTHTLDEQEQETISHMTNAEKLQRLNTEHEQVLIDQEELINSQQDIINGYELELENIQKILESSQQELLDFSNFYMLETLYNEEKYEECITYATELLQSENLSEQVYIIKFNEIVNDLIEKELLTIE